LRRAAHGVEIVWRAFELRPEPAPTLDPAGDYLRRAWETSVYPLAARLGVTMRLPPLQPRSRLAHEAAHWARTLGRFEDFHAAVFRAFFERGEDIGDAGTLASLASRIGLDADSLLAALASREFTESVVADEREARALGVTAVPAFIANRRAALSGVQTAENLRRLIEHARAR
jgi:predicted DsbA family dithiol-disulfide isomerase